MKKAISILLMLLVALSVLPAAFADETNQTEDTSDGQEDVQEQNEAEDGSDDEAEGEIKIEAKVKDGETEVEVKTDSLKLEFTTNTTDREGLVLEVMAKTGLSREQVEANLKLETEEEKDEKELHAMDSGHGAAVRLLQLEKAIARNVAHGKKVIELLGNSTNTTDLAAIVAEMETLREEVKNADPAAADAVQRFVDLKSDARDLAKQFRDKARGLLTEEQKKQVKEERNAEVEELNSRIKERLRAFNSERMRNLLKASGLEDEALLAKIKSGEVTAKEVLELMKDKVKAMDKQHRRDLQRSLKESKIKRAVMAKAMAGKARVNALERREGRLQERLLKLEQKGMKVESLEKYTKMRLDQLEAAKQRLQEKKGGRR